MPLVLWLAICSRARVLRISAFLRCNATEIIGHYSGPEKLDEKDIILTEKKVNFSMGAANPMDKVSLPETQCTCHPTQCSSGLCAK
jgi:hypothetical protein